MFFFAILVSLSSCKPAQSSRLKDAATTTSFKTGAFIPRTPSEFEMSDSVQPIGTKDFVDRARRLSRQPDLKLSTVDGLFYAVVTNGSGEQLLVTASSEDIPTPQISISGDMVYAWHQLLLGSNSSVAATDLFVRWPYGKALGKYKPEDMFVRREAWTAQGSKEPIIVPWLGHVKSETSDSIVFQAGNTILDARTGQPIMEFRRLENKPIWYVRGNYFDKDVGENTVFWRLEDGSYRSYTQNSPTVTVWKKQDDDSIDRVTTKPKSDEKIPTLALQFLEAAGSSAQNPEVKDPLKSFDAIKGDKRIFQLLRNKLYRDFDSTRQDSGSSSGFALAETGPTEPKDEELNASDFQNSEGAFNLGGFFSRQTPVRVNSVPGIDRSGSSTTYNQARWEDSKGQPQAGIVLSERNVFQPAGWVTKEKYVTHRTVKSPDGMIRDVDQYGNVQKTMSISNYKNMSGNEINIDRMQIAGGVDSSAMRKANNLSNVSNYQMQRQASLVKGESFNEMSGRLLVNGAIGQVSAQVTHGLDASTPGAALTSIGTTVVGGMAKDAIAGKSGENIRWGSGERFLTSGYKAAGNALLKRDNAAPAASPILGAAVDTAAEAFKRRADFNPKQSPDYAFDSNTSYAALLMPAVATGTAEFVTYGAPKSRAVTAAKTAVKDGISTLGNETEAISRSWRANTLEWERGNILEGPLQRRRDATAAQEGLNTLNRLGN
jgi:hypothetical protein